MGSICEESVGEYAGHLRSIADFGGSHRGYVSHLATLERHDSTIRATTSAVALGVELGLLPPNDASMPQRTAKAAKKFALPAWRPYGDERHLEAMARATGGVGEGGSFVWRSLGRQSFPDTAYSELGKCRPSIPLTCLDKPYISAVSKRGPRVLGYSPHLFSRGGPNGLQIRDVGGTGGSRGGTLACPIPGNSILRSPPCLPS